MTTRYQKRHYEDVARILRPYANTAERGMFQTIGDNFADLFAADNPDSVYCAYCDTTSPDDSCLGQHPEEEPFTYHYGFSRERFLAACGLESEG